MGDTLLRRFHHEGTKDNSKGTKNKDLLVATSKSYSHRKRAFIVLLSVLAVVIKGDPISRPAEIRNVTVVFKDGVGYDSAKLIEACRGLVGIR
jgi:hypothetical protein